MRTVYKYPLFENQLRGVVIPVNASLLSVERQDGKLYVWAEVNTNNDSETIDFIVLGTGEDISLHYTHLATLHEPPYVWHVYYKR